MNLAALVDNFHLFIKQNDSQLQRLEQGSFALALQKSKISMDFPNEKLEKLIKDVDFAELYPLILRVQKSHYLLVDKKNMLLLLLANKAEKLYRSFYMHLSEMERRFVMTLIYKIERLIDFLENKENDETLGLFFGDLNIIKKHSKSDAFLFPPQLNKCFLWLKKQDLDKEEISKNLLKSIEKLFYSRRKYYKNCDFYENTIKTFFSYEEEFKKFI